MPKNFFVTVSLVFGPDGRCFHVARAVSKSVQSFSCTSTKLFSCKVTMTDRYQICRPGRVSIHLDAQPRHTNGQRFFSGRGDVCSASGHIVNKFRRPAILQLNIEGLTASKMNVLHHLAVQFEALVILLQETHSAFTDKLVIPGFALAGSCLNRIHGLATFVHERLKWTLVNQSPFTSETEW